jgi:hypothetical protein
VTDNYKIGSSQSGPQIKLRAWRISACRPSGNSTKVANSASTFAFAGNSSCHRVFPQGTGSSHLEAMVVRRFEVPADIMHSTGVMASLATSYFGCRPSPFFLLA